MIKIFSYGRKVRVPLDDKGYNSNEYSLFTTVQYDEKDMEHFTIIDRNEYLEMAREMDKIQREIIEKETGITELPMDISKRRIKLKTRIALKEDEKPLTKLQELLKRRKEK